MRFYVNGPWLDRRHAVGLVISIAESMIEHEEPSPRDQDYIKGLLDSARTVHRGGGIGDRPAVSQRVRRALRRARQTCLHLPCSDRLRDVLLTVFYIADNVIVSTSPGPRAEVRLRRAVPPALAPAVVSAGHYHRWVDATYDQKPAPPPDSSRWQRFGRLLDAAVDRKHDLRLWHTAYEYALLGPRLQPPEVDEGSRRAGGRG